MMTTDDLRRYCEAEIKRMQAEARAYETAINMRRAGIAAYEDIIRQIDGVPDPAPTAREMPPEGT